MCVQCICLYVDADTTQGLVESVAAQPIPTIILEGKLRHATTNVEAATGLLEPPGLDQLAISEQKYNLRTIILIVWYAASDLLYMASPYP